VHHRCDDVLSLKLPRLAAEPFFPMLKVGVPKLLFWYRVLAQPLKACTDETTSFQPDGMLEIWKLPHFDD
jgi:hypothetical protein